jgi:hypothetical protein
LQSTQGRLQEIEVMFMTHVRKRYLPLLIGTLATGLAGVVNAQNTSSSD